MVAAVSASRIHLLTDAFFGIQIVGSNAEEQKMFGRHFDMEDELVSHISRRSIDILKTNYRVSGEEVVSPSGFSSNHSFWHKNWSKSKPKLNAGWIIDGRMEASCETEEHLQDTVDWFPLNIQMRTLEIETLTGLVMPCLRRCRTNRFIFLLLTEALPEDLREIKRETRVFFFFVLSPWKVLNNWFMNLHAGKLQGKKSLLSLVEIYIIL